MTQVSILGWTPHQAIFTPTPTFPSVASFSSLPSHFFSPSPFFSTLMQHLVALHFARRFFLHHVFIATLCLATCTSAFSGHNVTEDSHYFSWEGMMSLIRYAHIPFYFRFSFTLPTSLIYHYIPPLRCNHTTIALASSDWSRLFDGHMTYNSHVFTSILSVSNMPPPVVQPITSSHCVVRHFL